jgi:hypothetical protein
LSLKPRQSFKAEVGQPDLLFFDGSHEVFHRIVATFIADRLEAIEDPAGPIVVLVELVLDDPNEGGQDGVAAWSAAVFGEALLLDILLDGVAVQSQALSMEYNRPHEPQTDEPCGVRYAIPPGVEAEVLQVDLERRDPKCSKGVA